MVCWAVMVLEAKHGRETRSDRFPIFQGPVGVADHIVLLAACCDCGSLHEKPGYWLSEAG